MQLFFAISLFILAAMIPVLSLASPLTPPPLMLAKNFIKGLDVSKYYVSEKLDGVRAYWDGEALYTRSGREIEAPVWFLSALPKNKLDGELWIGKGLFDEVSGLIRRNEPGHELWHQVKYMVYDLPDMIAPFHERYWLLKTLIAGQRKPWLKALTQRQLSSEAELTRLLNQVTAGGGEGLMLRQASALYQVKRSNDLLKLKLIDDSEATVVGYIPGQGKYQGMMGALLVRDPMGREFRLGSGFTDQQRLTPPLLGAQVTYSFNGLTKNGLPRFARFLRERPDE